MLRYGLVFSLLVSTSVWADDIAEAQAHLNSKKEHKMGATSTSANKTYCKFARFAGKGIPSLKDLISSGATEGAQDV